MPRVCVDCGKSLVAVGTARVGGKQSHGDWATRRLHKQCLAARNRAGKAMEEPGPYEEEHRAAVDTGAPGSYSQRKRRHDGAPSTPPRRAGPFGMPASIGRSASGSPATDDGRHAKGPRTYLDVPYTEKDEAKALGARWDAMRKKWWVSNHSSLAPFERWIGAGEAWGSSASSGPACAASLNLAARLRNAAQEGDTAAAFECIAEAKDWGGGGTHPAINACGAARGGTRNATPLRFAAFHGYLDIVRALLEAGAIATLREVNANGEDCHDEKDALELARVGNARKGARGDPASRYAVVSALDGASAKERFELTGVTDPARQHLNGLEVDVRGVNEDSGKWVVRPKGSTNLYSLSQDKVRRRPAAATGAAGAGARRHGEEQAAAQLPVGAMGVVHGLSSGTAYNGAVVTIEAHDRDRKRYTVRFVASGRGFEEGSQLTLKVANVKPL